MTEIRAGIYVRMSMDRTGAGLGVTRQEEDCRALAKQLGWEVVELYPDNDESATSSKPRPHYRRMLADINAGQINAIIAWHPDRLYRKVTDLGDLVDACKRHNVQIATCNAGTVDLTTPTGRLVAGLLAQVATYEVEHKTERWLRSYRQAREQGRFVSFGNRMFGYTQHGEIVDEEAAVARRVAGEVIAGRSLTAIANDLDRDKIRTTAGNAWTHTTLKTYLTNPRITALAVDHGDIVGEGQWEPILDRETWETVKAVLATRPGGTRGPRVALLSGGLIVCGVCGHKLVTSGHPRGRRYRCPKRPDMKGCGGPSISADQVEEYVEGWARARLSDPRVIERAAQLRAGEDSRALLDEIASLEERLAELDEELERPGVPVARITRAMDKVAEQLETARGRLAEATDLAASEPYSGGEPWPRELLERRRLVRIALGDRVVVLDPATRRGPGFDPERIRFARRK